MNDIVAHTLSAYTSAFDAATNTNASTRTIANDSQNSSPTPIVPEELPLSLVVIPDVTNTRTPIGNIQLNATDKTPLRKLLSVRWKDQPNTKNALDSTTLSDDEVLKAENDEDLPVMENPLKAKIVKKRSPSPPHLDIKEYECRMKKLKASIGEACKLELKYLNQAKHVRDKRTRMVEKLKHMKRKAQRFNVLNAQRHMHHSNSSSSEMDVVPTKTPDGNNAIITDDDDFVLPPVYPEKPTRAKSSASYVDMTQ